MPTYRVTDPATGRTLSITGESEPTEQELGDIFGSAPATEPTDEELSNLVFTDNQKFVNSLWTSGRAPGIQQPKPVAPTSAPVALTTKPKKEDPGFFGAVDELAKGFAGPRILASSALGAVRNFISPVGIAALETDRPVATPIVESIMSGLKNAQEYVRPAKTGNYFADKIIEGAESTGTSLVDMAGMALLTKGKGRKFSTLPKAIMGKGALFGTAEYYDFMSEVKDELVKQGASKDDINDALNKIRPWAAASGAAEIAGEVSTDLLSAKVFGLLGDKTVKPVVKETVKQLIKRVAPKFGISLAGEEGGELLTTTAQWGARKGAGLESGGLGQQLQDTAVTTAVQTVLQGGLAVGGKKVLDRRNVAKFVNAGLDKETAGKFYKEIKNDVQSGKTPEEIQAKVKTRLEEQKPVEVDVDKVQSGDLKVLEEQMKVAIEAEAADKKASEEKPIVEEAKPEEVKAAEEAQAPQPMVGAGEEVAQIPEAKTLVEFIGLQENLRGKPPLVLVNGSDKSTVVFDPEKHEIQNVTDYEAAMKPAEVQATPVESTPKEVSANGPTEEKETAAEATAPAVEEKEKMLKAERKVKAAKAQTEEPSPESGYVQKLNVEDIQVRSAEQLDKVNSYTGWKWDIGDRVRSSKTGKMWEVTDKYWDKKNGPTYGMQTTDGEERSRFYENNGKVSVYAGFTKMGIQKIETQEKIPTIYKTRKEATQAIARVGNPEELGVKKVSRGWQVENKEVASVADKPRLELIEKPKLSIEHNPEFLDADTAKQHKELYTGRKIGSVETAFAQVRAEVNNWYHTGKGDIEAAENNILSLSKVYENYLEGEAVKKFADGLKNLGMLVAEAKKLRSQAGFIDLTDAVKTAKWLRTKLGKFVTDINWKRHTIPTERYEEHAFGVRQIRGEEDVAEMGDELLLDEDGKHVWKKVDQKDVPLLKTVFGHSYLRVKGLPLARILSIKTIMAERRSGHDTERDAIYIQGIEKSLTTAEAEELQRFGLNLMERSASDIRDLLGMGWTPAESKLLKDEWIKQQIDVWSAPDHVKEAYRKVRDYYNHMQMKHKAQLYRDMVRGLKYGKAIEEASKTNQWADLYVKAGVTTAADITRCYNEVKNFLTQCSEISKWGDDEYMTHLMAGNIRLIDTTKDKDGKPSGNIITIAVTEKEALAQARQYMLEHPETNSIKIEPRRFDEYDMPVAVGKKKYQAMLGRADKAIEKMNVALQGLSKELEAKKLIEGAFTIDPGHPFTPPILENKGELPGEKNPFVAMKMYSRAMNRYINYSDVINDFKQHIDKLPLEVRRNLTSALEWSLGKYDFIDRSVDTVIGNLTGNHWQPHRLASRTLGKMKSFAVMKDLGYRLGPLIQNSASGFGNILAEYRVEKMIKAIVWLQTEDGQQFQIDVAPYLSSGLVEEAGQLRLAMRAAGQIRDDYKALFAPMGMFAEVERAIRPLDAAVSYLDIREREPSWDKEMQTMWVVDNLLRHQGLGTRAEAPRWQRNTLGWTLSLFQRYIGRQVEQWAYNWKSPAYYAEAGLQLITMAGWRGAVWTARSLVAMAVLDGLFYGGDWLLGLDKIEQWVLANYPRAANGVFGYIGKGFSLTAQGTVQLPNKPEDFAGAVFLDMVKLAKIAATTVGICMQLGSDKSLEEIGNDGVAEITRQVRGLVPSLRPWLENLEAGREDLENVKNFIPFGQGVIEMLQEYMTSSDGNILDSKGRPLYKPDNFDKFIKSTPIPGLALGGKSIEQDFAQIGRDINYRTQGLKRKEIDKLAVETTRRMAMGQSLGGKFEEFVAVNKKYGYSPDLDAGKFKRAILDAVVPAEVRDINSYKRNLEILANEWEAKMMFINSYGK